MAITPIGEAFIRRCIAAQLELERAGLLAHIPIREQISAPAICMVSRANRPLTPLVEYLSDLFRRATLNAN